MMIEWMDTSTQNMSPKLNILAYIPLKLSFLYRSIGSERFNLFIIHLSITPTDWMENLTCTVLKLYIQQQFFIYYTHQYLFDSSI